MSGRAQAEGALLLSCAAALAWAAAQLAAPPRPMAAPEAVDALLALVDDDRDGRVSTAELQRHADRVGPSARFDRDGDGALDRAELDLLLSSLSPHPPQPNALPGAL